MTQFNITLLAKQGWRLLIYPNSLVAQVFKAKYFSIGDFINSRLGHSGSYVWRSIWATKAIVEKSLFWRVDTGTDISVQNDAWIPNCNNVNLVSVDNNLHVATVAKLINSYDRIWDRDLIVNTFQVETAELIIRILLALEPHVRVWSGESSGEFSVRSTYKLLQKIDPTTYALQNLYKEFYKKLWRIDLPSKIKLLIWRISWNFLPTKVNLALRGVIRNTFCPRCGEREEDMNHIFRECPVTKSVWRDLSDPSYAMFPNAEFLEWLTKILVLLPSKNCRVYCGTLWAIWGDRNSRIHNKRGRSSQEMVQFVYGYLKELDGLKTVNQKTMYSEVKWRHPPGQILKINFDGAFDKRQKQSASGVVVRDRNGHVLLTKSELHDGVESAFAAKALTCHRDSLSIIKKCNKPDLDRSVVGVYIQDIRRLKAKCRKIRFEHTPRMTNNLTHIIATKSLKQREEIYLIEAVPSYAELQARDESMREPD
ncbi:reverse transcriptase [Gossypium australe]|uniref:Reverse transcriptase n=1 Tax=Gossypium australe TaxID=47621 RepID=A0A5B6WD74_9ROSI|nr:reverse transcriptase [Gossypium australe]